jgi:hypothetical protein
MSTNRNKQTVRKSDPIYLHSLVCNVSMKTAMQSWIYKGLNLKSLGIWKSVISYKLWFMKKMNILGLIMDWTL